MSSRSYYDEDGRGDSRTPSPGSRSRSYTPSPSSNLDVIRHAKFIGIDPVEDAGYMWLAKEAFEAELPKGWVSGEGEGEYAGLLYYYNEETGKSTWDHPLDDYYRQKFRDLKREGKGKVEPRDVKSGKGEPRGRSHDDRKQDQTQRTAAGGQQRRGSGVGSRSRSGGAHRERSTTRQRGDSYSSRGSGSDGSRSQSRERGRERSRGGSRHSGDSNSNSRSQGSYSRSRSGSGSRSRSHSDWDSDKDNDKNQKAGKSPAVTSTSAVPSKQQAALSVSVPASTQRQQQEKNNNSNTTPIQEMTIEEGSWDDDDDNDSNLVVSLHVPQSSKQQSKSIDKASVDRAGAVKTQQKSSTSDFQQKDKVSTSSNAVTGSNINKYKASTGAVDAGGDSDDEWRTPSNPIKDFAPHLSGVTGNKVVNNASNKANDQKTTATTTAYSVNRAGGCNVSSVNDVSSSRNDNRELEDQLKAERREKEQLIADKVALEQRLEKATLDVQEEKRKLASIEDDHRRQLALSQDETASVAAKVRSEEQVIWSNKVTVAMEEGRRAATVTCQAEITKLQLQVSGLERQLSSTNDKQISELREKLTTQTKAAEDMGVRLASVTQEHADSAAKVAMVMQDLKRAREEADQSKAAQLQSSSDAEEATRELNKLKLEVKDLAQQLMTAKNENEALERSLQNKQCDLDRFITQNRSGDDKVELLRSQLQSEKTSHESQCSSMNRRLVELEASYNTLKREMAVQDEAQMDKLRHVETEKTRIEYDLKRATDKAASAELWRAKESERANQLELMVAETHAELNNIKNDMKRQSDSIDSAIQPFKKDKFRLEELLGESQRDVKELKLQLEHAEVAHRAELSTMRMEVTSKMPELAESAVKHAEEQWRRNRELETKALKLEFDKKCEQYTSQISALKGAMMETEARKHAELTAEKSIGDTLRSKAERLEQENKALAAQCEELTKFVSQANGGTPQQQNFNINNQNPQQHRIPTNIYPGMQVQMPYGYGIETTMAHETAMLALQRHIETLQAQTQQLVQHSTAALVSAGASTSTPIRSTGGAQVYATYAVDHDIPLDDEGPHDDPEELERRLNRLLQTPGAHVTGNTVYGKEKGRGGEAYKIAAAAKAAMMIDPETFTTHGGHNNNISMHAPYQGDGRSSMSSPGPSFSRIEYHQDGNSSSTNVLDKTDGGFHLGYWKKKYARTPARVR